MITVLHGDSTAQSREELNKLTVRFRLAVKGEIVRLDGKRATSADLTQALESDSLFGGKRLIVIENLLNLPRSKAKEELLQLVAANNQAEIIIWNKKMATSRDLKKLPGAKVKEFKAPKAVWQFLDAFRPGQAIICLKSLHQALKQEAAELIFYLLHRRVSQLLQAKSGSLKGSPWQVSKLNNQADSFKTAELVSWLDRLARIDFRIKSGKDDLPISGQLDLALAKL